VFAVLNAGEATAVIAGLALIGAIWTIRQADASSRRALTAAYSARWDHPELLEARVITSDFLRLDGTEEDARWEEWNKELLGAAKSIQILAILNFWEEVASAFNEGLLDDVWFRSNLAWTLEDNWDRAAWFIRRYRHEDKNACFYSEWQLAVEAVQDDLAEQGEQGRRRAAEAIARGEDLLRVDQTI
jgi:hypothetical protein